MQSTANALLKREDVESTSESQPHLGCSLLHLSVRFLCSLLLTNSLVKCKRATPGCYSFLDYPFSRYTVSELHS